MVGDCRRCDGDSSRLIKGNPYGVVFGEGSVMTVATELHGASILDEISHDKHVNMSDHDMLIVNVNVTIVMFGYVEYEGIIHRFSPGVNIGDS